MGRIRARVLTEGERDDHFARHLLKQWFGVHPNEIRFVPSGAFTAGGRATGGSGGRGTSWVLKHLSDEAKNLHAFRNQTGLILVVVIDADELTVAQRRSELLNEVAAAHRSDRLCFVISRRTLETWAEYLKGSVVDETTNYKRSLPGRYGTGTWVDWEPLVARLVEFGRSSFGGAHSPPPESLEVACAELARLEAALPL